MPNRSKMGPHQGYDSKKNSGSIVDINALFFGSVAPASATCMPRKSLYAMNSPPMPNRRATRPLNSGK